MSQGCSERRVVLNLSIEQMDGSLRVFGIGTSVRLAMSQWAVCVYVLGDLTQALNALLRLEERPGG